MTTYTDHLLDLLQEEAAELIVAISKLKRFGPDDFHRSDPTPNRVKVQLEFNDVLAVAEMIKENGLFITRDPELIKRKRQKVNEMLLYSKAKGRVK